MSTRPYDNLDRRDFHYAEQAGGFPRPESYSRSDQIIYSGLSALAAATLVVARVLHPSSNGYGTHQQLGLPPCAFFKLTGIPCPSCGLTTSFAHAARFHFFQAFLTQPFGLLGFCLTVLSIPMFLLLLRRRIAWTAAIHARGVDWMLRALIALYLLSWVYKIAAVKTLAGS